MRAQSNNLLLLTLGGYLKHHHCNSTFSWVDLGKAIFEVTGVGKEMEEMALIHFSLPFLITLFVTIVFVLFGLYGLSAVGKLRKLPFQKVVIFSIATIYILRGVLQLFSDVLIKGEGAALGTIYSGIAFAIGLLYLIGGLKKYYIK